MRGREWGGGHRESERSHDAHSFTVTSPGLKKKRQREMGRHPSLDFVAR